MVNKSNTEVIVYVGLDKTPIAFSKQDLIKHGIAKAINNNMSEFTLMDIFNHPNIDVVDCLIRPHLDKINLNDFLNNFLGHLPLSLDWETWEKKFSHSWLGYENIPKIDFYEKMNGKIHKRSPLKTALRYEETPYEHHQMVSKCIMDNKDISPQDYEKEINRFVENATSSWNSKNKEIRDNRFRQAENLARKLRPTYVALRKMGYSDYDLTS